MKSYLIIIISFVSLLFASCKNENHPNDASKNEYFVTEQSRTSELQQNIPRSQNSNKENIVVHASAKIIKEATLRIETNDYDKTYNLIKKQIALYEGYISNENETNKYDLRANQILIRVPSPYFDSLTYDICKLAWKLHEKKIKAYDVSEEFYDAEARLKTKKEIERRYFELLKTAKTIDEMLKVENALGVIREDIESKEGRLKYLQNKVDYSVVSISLFQKIDGINPEDAGFFNKLGTAFHYGWKGLLIIAIGLVYLWPFLLICLVAFIAFFFKKKKR